MDYLGNLWSEVLVRWNSMVNSFCLCNNGDDDGIGLGLAHKFGSCLSTDMKLEDSPPRVNGSSIVQILYQDLY